ncbi:NUDIX domain-containing protein [Gammaproteobacteria bacterium]|jgi:ADP-ribose pyrophosphatase|nr:NUDIX domain-containing protein [Gammaproteobacteria bacterium]MBT4782018.1 NUDIX domain-containing protein [Gammaproteobacteria bacterium]MBT6317210.1 NUDIX domain-containing protein [Gammaproteobacteria bacterium]MBT6548459.1 NUDIX domain-containing protein [Gammaproteobacteria bacterium]MBT7764739.1 NUDIX domain-containing protein [Gammaproteobacteria bacterium]
MTQPELKIEVDQRETLFDSFLRVDRLKLRHSLFAGGWSELMTRELILRPRAVGVLLFDPAQQQVVLVRQIRVGMLDEGQNPWLLELVAGMVESGEEPIEVAARESLEEANTKPQDLLQICEYYNSPGISNERITLFCGRVDATQAGGIFGLDAEHEDIEVVVLSLADALAKVASGEINNAMSIIALQWLQLNQPMLEESWK